jgi:hypothetical protein
MDHSVLKQLPISPVLYRDEQFKTIAGLEEHSFQFVADKALAIEQQKFIQGDITKQNLGMFISRLRAQLVPYFFWLPHQHHSN